MPWAENPNVTAIIVAGLPGKGETIYGIKFLIRSQGKSLDIHWLMFCSEM